VAGLGRDRRPDAVAALAAGPLTVERPAFSWTVHLKAEALYEEHVTELLAAGGEEPHALWRLGRAMGDQERLFKWRSGVSGTVTDEQLRNVRLASQMGAALFRVARAEPGAEVEVVIDGRPLRYRAQRGEKTGPGPWHTATAFALITGSREDLAPLVLTGPTYTAPDGSAFSAYREALHAYLTGTDCEAAAEQALRQAEKARDWGWAMPPAVLLSQLVEGDEESFNLALADALEAHRAHYQVADRADDPDAAVDLDALALACHARRRGWEIRVDSAYLPKGLLQAAEPF
ncbi:immunity 49 family protein, partial [Streptomyces californicus]